MRVLETSCPIISRVWSASGFSDGESVSGIVARPIFDFTEVGHATDAEKSEIVKYNKRMLVDVEEKHPWSEIKGIFEKAVAALS